MSKLITRSSVAGTTLSGAELKAALTGIVDALNSAGLQSGARSTLTGNATLTTTQAGLVLVDCTAGNVVLTLPASGDTTDDASFLIRRLDASGNTLQVQRSGSDTVEGGTSALSVLPGGILGLQMPADGADWKVFALSGATAAAARAALAAAGSGAIGSSGLTMATGKVLLRSTAGSGAIEEGDVAGGISMSGGVLLAESPMFDIDASVAANSLTITINPGVYAFRSATLTDGTPVLRRITSPLTLTVSNGSTLGTVNGSAARLAVLVLDNAGTLEAAVVNVAGGTQLDECNLISTTAEGGAGAADSASTVYSASARSSLAYRVAGFIDITQATAGTWASAPTQVQGAGGNAASSMQSLGYSQTWQVAGVGITRAKDTTYYNTTGRPIYVSIQWTVSGGGGNFSINGSIVQTTNGQVQGCFAFIVPPNASYAASTGSGTFTTGQWAELR